MLQRRAVNGTTRRACFTRATALDVGPCAVCERLTNRSICAASRFGRPSSQDAFAIQRAAQTLALTVFAGGVAVTEHAPVQLAHATAGSVACLGCAQNAGDAA